MEELVKAIEVVHSGRAMINPDIATKVLRLFSELARPIIPFPFRNLRLRILQRRNGKSLRKWETGHPIRKFPETLALSEGTVRNYLSTILNKLDLRDRTQLAIWVVQRRMGR